MKRISYIIITGFLSIFLASCDKYLDVVPDNRAELDTQDKIRKLLVSGYSTASHYLVTEMSSDNVDDNGISYTPFITAEREAFYRLDFTETTQDTPHSMWQGFYHAIAVANQALEAIEKLGNKNGEFNAEVGEALIIRAYNHFMLVNIFCQHYSPLHANQDLGIPYITAPETTVKPEYSRGTVAEVYKKIDEDIQAALPLINDANYQVPKYRFNQAASYAFAARFYLYYLDFNKSVQYATLALGQKPEAMMRDWAALGKESNWEVVTNAYINNDVNANFLLKCVNSYWPYIHGPWARGTRYAHGTEITRTETSGSTGPWGVYTNYHRKYMSYTSLPKTVSPKFNIYFEWVDRVAGTGYPKMIMTEFTAEETLLCRAEAYFMLDKYDEGVQDLNTLLDAYCVTHNKLVKDDNVSAGSIPRFYNRIEYYAPTAATVKKRLNPDFDISGNRENFIHCVLHLRRIMTLHEGLRWYDIKRYGIEVTRRKVDLRIEALPDPLVKRDMRCAIQLPTNVISGGLEPNPRP